MWEHVLVFRCIITLFRSGAESVWLREDLQARIPQLDESVHFDVNGSPGLLPVDGAFGQASGARGVEQAVDGVLGHPILPRDGHLGRWASLTLGQQIRQQMKVAVAAQALLSLHTTCDV